MCDYPGPEVKFSLSKTSLLDLAYLHPLFTSTELKQGYSGSQFNKVQTGLA